MYALKYFISLVLCFTILEAATMNLNGNDIESRSGLGRALPNHCCPAGYGWGEVCLNCLRIPNPEPEPECVKLSLLKISPSVACLFAKKHRSERSEESSSSSSSSEENCYSNRDCSGYKKCIRGQCKNSWYRSGNERSRPTRFPPPPRRRCYHLKNCYRNEKCIHGWCEDMNTNACFNY